MYTVLYIINVSFFLKRRLYFFLSLLMYKRISFFYCFHHKAKKSQIFSIFTVCLVALSLPCGMFTLSPSPCTAWSSFMRRKIDPSVAPASRSADIGQFSGWAVYNY